MRIEVHDEVTLLQRTSTEIISVQASRTVVLTPLPPSQCSECGFDVASMKDCPDCGGCVMCCGCKPGEG
jgi:hypothetical protein